MAQIKAYFLPDRSRNWQMSRSGLGPAATSELSNPALFRFADKMAHTQARFR